ncbi:hypothetical protein QTP86_028895 [Hemibagrus guttatus]|nr:hypothetical protein QTP86_028895 [Hemibagrus guttatus]
MPTPSPCLTTTVECPENTVQVTIPREYNDLREVFSKERAADLSAHHPWDCAIDLIPNAMPPKSRVYPLSIPERKAMEEYIEEALATGYIRPSTSSWGKRTVASLHRLQGLECHNAALEEWRHWLEGARHPFLILTDHRNLEYLRNAKCLNARQARWALFFTRFHFSVTYRPGSKNGKADALSRKYETKSSPSTPEPILPFTTILGLMRWELMEEIQ